MFTTPNALFSLVNKIYFSLITGRIDIKGAKNAQLLK
jgi:hypothetical protein